MSRAIKSANNGIGWTGFCLVRTFLNKQENKGHSSLDDALPWLRLDETGPSGRSIQRGIVKHDDVSV